MKIVPFKSEHLSQIELQPAQYALRDRLKDNSYGQALEAGSDAYTVIYDGNVLCCAGVAPVWEGKAMAWVLMSKDAGVCMTRIVKAIRRYLALSEYKRIEAFTEADFTAGKRMLQMLGFRCEGFARCYTPDGRDCFLFGLVKD